MPRPRRPIYHILTLKDVIQKGDEVYNNTDYAWGPIHPAWWGKYPQPNLLLRRRLKFSRMKQALGKKYLPQGVNT